VKLSDKQLAFIGYPSRIDVAEGASGTGKSQALKMKLMARINESPRKQHFISGESGPVIYRNIIEDEYGVLALFRNVREGRDARKGNYLDFIDTKGRHKIIYIFGFGDESKWKKVLGSTMGCGIIDEANLAPYNFIVQCFRALTRPTIEFWLGLSLNPTEPTAEIYKALINKARPTSRYFADIPRSIISDLSTAEPMADCIYWHFNHADNPTLTPEATQMLRDALIPGTPEYMSLIEGLRSSGTGTIYAKYLNDSFIYDTSPVFQSLDIGIDIGSGGNTGAASILGITGFTRQDGRVHVWAEDDYECLRGDVDGLLDEWIDQIEIWWKLYQTRIRGIYVDGAGVSVTLIRSLNDRLIRRNIMIEAVSAWKFGADGGIRARMFVMYALINQRRLHIKRGNKLYENLRKIQRSDKPGVLIRDDNDIWNDYYDMFCYSWTHKTEELR